MQVLFKTLKSSNEKPVPQINTLQKSPNTNSLTDLSISNDLTVSLANNHMGAPITIDEMKLH